MEIRKLGWKDLSIARDILDHLGADPEHPSIATGHLVRVLIQENACVLAAMQAGRTLGFLLAYTFPSFYADENMAYLYDIEVWPEHRNQGIGRQLIRHLLDHLRVDNVAEIWLGPATQNFAAQRLFSLTGA